MRRVKHATHMCDGTMTCFWICILRCAHVRFSSGDIQCDINEACSTRHTYAWRHYERRYMSCRTRHTYVWRWHVEHVTHMCDVTMKDVTNIVSFIGLLCMSNTSHICGMLNTSHICVTSLWKTLHIMSLYHVTCDCITAHMIASRHVGLHHITCDCITSHRTASRHTSLHHVT